MENIRSGQAYLYREGGIQSTVIDIRMKDNICGDSLTKGLNRTLLRYPYLTNKMKEQNGDFYLIENPLPFIIEETSKLHSLGSSKVNYHLIDVTYKDKQIKVAFHHGLCDGRGVKPFVETLLYYYCTYRYKNKFYVPDVRLAGEPLLPGETKEPFDGKKFDVGDTMLPKVTKDGYALPESINQDGERKYYRYELNINHEKFINFAKEQKQEDVVKTNANNMAYLSDKLDEMDSYEAKKMMMSFFNNISLNTFIISYLGQTKLGDCEKYIDSMHMYSSGTNGLVMNMLSVGEYITIDFLQSFETEIYRNAFIQAIEEAELDFNVSEKIEFKTPGDSNYNQAQVVA